LAQGSIAGLWLAPFVAQKDSRLVKDHPEWILKDAQGNFELAGYGWGFNYCLDLENTAVRDYLRHCFDVVLNEWGYGLVKLDFLYAAALGHHPTKTRGQRMAEAMDFLRSCVKDKLILGCGVPLGSAFGMVDYCRIGPDISLDWDGPWYYQLIHRERVSTKNAILNTIGRRHLDHRAFLNDPDVFLLRKDNILMTPAQKEVLTQVNRIFGSLLFTSDLISDYDEVQRKQWEEASALTHKLILSVNHPAKDKVEVHYREAESNHLALINLSKKPHTFRNGITVRATSIEILDV
jgi:alpha-galactosidase